MYYILLTGGKPLGLYPTLKDAKNGVRQMRWKSYCAIYQVACGTAPVKVYELFGRDKCHSTEQLTKLSVTGTLCRNQYLCRIYKKNEQDVAESFWSLN